ncbi:MAG: helix-turn-helix transcriptional regulator [Gammaproteobacteria bacterium]
MNDTKAIRIASVKYADEYKLRLRWVSGKTMVVDLSEPVHRLKGLRPLRNQPAFTRAAKGEGGHSVVWPGEIGMGADRLWEMSLEQNGHLDAVEFIRWRWRYGLSLSDAADALGLSRRQVAYYASGERAVPRTVLLACKGWEAERQSAAA